MSDTGWFLSIDNRGRQRYDGDRALKELRVKGTKDGILRSFIDDLADDEGAPNQARSHMLQRIGRKDRNGVPLFYVDKAVPDIPGPMGIMITVPVYDDKIKAAQAEYMKARGDVRARAEAEVAASRPKAKAAQRKRASSDVDAS